MKIVRHHKIFFVSLLPVIAIMTYTFFVPPANFLQLVIVLLSCNISTILIYRVEYLIMIFKIRADEELRNSNRTIKTLSSEINHFKHICKKIESVDTVMEDENKQHLELYLILCIKAFQLRCRRQEDQKFS